MQPAQTRGTPSRPSTPATPGLRRPDAPLTDEARALVRDHLPVVGYLVSEVMPRLPAHVLRDDLVSAGHLALVQAARAYDGTTGVPFGHYARTRIRGALVDELRAADWATRSVRSKARQITSTQDRLAGELGRWPTDVELANELQTDQRSMSAAKADLHRSVVLSLDQLVEVNGSSDEHLDPTMHHMDAAQHVVQSERMAFLVAAVAVLPERLRLVVEQYFLAERPMAEIAEQLGVSESRVSQLRAEALVLLRDGINSNLDPSSVPPPERPDGVVARRRSAYYAQVAAYAAVKLPAPRTSSATARPGARAASTDVTRSA
ncbi:MAG TPA: sigma-70 family RNA polymerase sigma factor [Actinomycetales bacterium]|jgi:RNA polymerase sigma factor for flagellar operon FliA